MKYSAFAHTLHPSDPEGDGFTTTFVFLYPNPRGMFTEEDIKGFGEGIATVRCHDRVDAKYQKEFLAEHGYLPVPHQSEATLIDDEEEEDLEIEEEDDWDEEEEDLESEEEDDWDDDDDDSLGRYFDDVHSGGTGHGDISYSDADPGL